MRNGNVIGRDERKGGINLDVGTCVGVIVTFYNIWNSEESCFGQIQGFNFGFMEFPPCLWGT